MVVNMTEIKKWKPGYVYFSGDLIEAPEDMKQVALWAGHSGPDEPEFKQKRGEYTDDYGVRWKCGGKVNGVENIR
jgi:hypothetical protein